MTITIAEYRQMAGVTQREMADQMEMSRRTLEDIEAGKVAYRPVHEAAAKMALLRIAAARGDASFLPAGLQEVVRLVASGLPNPRS